MKVTLDRTEELNKMKVECDKEFLADNKRQPLAKDLLDEPSFEKRKEIIKKMRKEGYFKKGEDGAGFLYMCEMESVFCEPYFVCLIGDDDKNIDVITWDYDEWGEPSTEKMIEKFSQIDGVVKIVLSFAPGIFTFHEEQIIIEVKENPTNKQTNKQTNNRKYISKYRKTQWQ